jgi:hypothetical protein
VFDGYYPILTVPRHIRMASIKKNHAQRIAMKIFLLKTRNLCKVQNRRGSEVPHSTLQIFVWAFQMCSTCSQLPSMSGSVAFCTARQRKRHKLLLHFRWLLSGVLITWNFCNRRVAGHWLRRSSVVPKTVKNKSDRRTFVEIASNG